MEIKKCMKRQVFSVKSGTPLREAIFIFVAEKIGLLPVIDQEDHLVGAISLSDILNLFLPDFLNIVKDIDFVKDFGATELESTFSVDIEKVKKMSVDDIMNKEPVSVEDDSMVIRALALMKNHNLRDLLVTDKSGKLTGIASFVDLGRRLLEIFKIFSEKGETS